MSEYMIFEVEDSFSYLDKDDIESLTLEELKELEEEAAEAMEDDLEDLQLTNDLISLYKKDISRFPLLTHEQEIELSSAIKDGCESWSTLNNLSDSKKIINFGQKEHLEFLIQKAESSRETLINSNTRLVISIASKFLNYGLPFEDLIQEGNIGLLKAVEKFDHTKGWRFSTYATWWIMHDVRKAALENSTTIKITIGTHEQIRKVLNVRNELFIKLERFPTEKELASELDIDKAKLRKILHRYSLKFPVEVDRPVGDDDDETTIGDFIEGYNDDPSSHLIEKLAEELLEKALISIDEKKPEMAYRNRDIFKYINGTLDGETHTHQEAGEKFGVTSKRITQISKLLKGKVRAGRYGMSLRELLDAFNQLES